MADMLVKLFALPDRDDVLPQVAAMGVTIRRPMAYERQTLIQWVSKHFNDLWAQECAGAFGRQPVGCHIAVQADTLAGFCCVNCTYQNFAGPIGVLPRSRSRGIGRALLWSALNDLIHQGYAYAVIGDAGEPAFFEKTVGAIEIIGSKPGSYPPRLK